MMSDRTHGWRAMALALAVAGAMAVPVGARVQTAQGPVRAGISGMLAVVGGKVDPATLNVRINDMPVRIASDGRIDGAVAPATQYRLSVSGDDIFAATYHFGHAELADTQGRLALPPIEVVARAPGRVEMFFGGDTMIGRRYVEPIWDEPVRVRDASRAADMAALLAPMQPYFVQSDLASLNLETVLATEVPGDAPDKSVVFHTHSDAAGVLAAAGIDYVSLGNNHVYDYLETGLKRTTDALDAAGIAWSGAGPDEATALKGARITLGGSRYSMLGYVGWKGQVEPNQVAETGKGGAAFGSDANIRVSVRAERAAGYLPVVQYHGSSEYSDRPTEISERRMKLAIDEGAALVVSHHPHVAHGFELHRGRLIAYSLGNYLFDQYFPETHGSVALKVWMDGDRLFRAEILPIQILDYRPVPAIGGFRQAMLRRVASLSAERGTQMRLVAGHGVIAPDQPRGGDAARSGATVGNGRGACAETMTAGIAAHTVPLSSGDGSCVATVGSLRGRDLLVRGDFEGAQFGDVRDRHWEAGGATFGFGGPAHRGTGALVLNRVDPATAMTLAPRSFFRSTGARRMSLAGWIRADAPVTVAAAVQMHPARTNRFKALVSAPTEAVGTATLDAGGWQPFRFDIVLDEAKRALPLRPVLTISGTDRVVAIDDLAFIAWDATGARPDDYSHSAADFQSGAEP